MKSFEFLRENTAPKPQPGGKDPNKMLALKVWADSTFPMHEMSKLGRIDMNNPQATAKVRDLLTTLLRQSMGNTDFINLAIQPDADVMLNWLLDRYSRGMINYEDASGEGVDALAKWAALRNQPPQVGRKNNRFPTDVNAFRDVKQLQMLVQDAWYNNVLEKLKNQEEINKHKRSAKEIVLIDNPRFHVAIPLNFGSCYVFNNAEGKQANFCTGGSSGLYWFNNYAKNGPMISITDKRNVDRKEGKWQIHSHTDQFVNSEQDSRWNSAGNATEFGKLFPGLMKDIVREMLLRKDEIRKGSIEEIKGVDTGGYDVDAEVKELRDKFPGAFTDHDEAST